MNGTRAREFRRQAFDETGYPFRSDRQQYKMMCPDSKMASMTQGKHWGTLVCVGGRRLYKDLKKQYREGR